MTPRVMGLDLSLRRSGYAIVGADWDLEWSRIVVGAIGRPLPKNAAEHTRLGRLDLIANELVRIAGRHEVTHVFVESYAYSAMASQAHALDELGGVVKRDLWRLGLPLEVVPPASARALLGRLPRKDVKAHVRGLLTKMGAPTSWEGDEADAFVAANWGLVELGECAIIARAA